MRAVTELTSDSLRCEVYGWNMS